MEPYNQNILGQYGGPHLPTARARIGGVAPVATVKPKFLGRNSAPPTDTRQTWPDPAQPGPARRSPIQPDPPRGAVLGQEGAPVFLVLREPWPGWASCASGQYIYPYVLRLRFIRHCIAIASTRISHRRSKAACIAWAGVGPGGTRRSALQALVPVLVLAGRGRGPL